MKMIFTHYKVIFIVVLLLCIPSCLDSFRYVELGVGGRNMMRRISNSNAKYVRNVKISMAKDDYPSMKIDESKLSQSERERLAFIQKLTLEADDMIKAAGFNLENEEEEEEEEKTPKIKRSIKETEWSGTSTSTST